MATKIHKEDKMFIKLSLLIMTALAASSALAQPLLCERPGSTRSFEITLDAYQSDGKNWAAVDVIQYPSKKTLFYHTSQSSQGKNQQIILENETIYFQADRKMILRIDPKNNVSLEVFWIRGSSGFGFGGESGSIFYQCR